MTNLVQKTTIIWLEFIKVLQRTPLLWREVFWFWATREFQFAVLLITYIFWHMNSVQGDALFNITDFFSLQILVPLKTILDAILVACDLLCFTTWLQFKVYSGSRQCCDILIWYSSSKVWMPYVLYWFDLIRASVHDVAVTPVESGEAKYGDGNSYSAWKLMLEMLE